MSLPCLACGKPYVEHTYSEEWDMEESCHMEGYSDTYCDPEQWESFCELATPRERQDIQARARACGVEIPEPATPSFRGLENR